MDDYKEKLKKELVQYLVENPEDGPYFLDAISLALKKYKEKINISRSIQTSNALNMVSLFILDSKSLNKLSIINKIIFLTDIVFLMFPESKVINHSEGEKEFLNFYLNLFNSEQLIKEIKEWIKNTRDKEYIQWFDLLLNGIAGLVK